MIDLICVFIPFEGFLDRNDSSSLSPEFKSRITSAKRSSIRCTRFEEGMYISCSLPKLFHSSNVEPLRFCELGEALFHLEKELFADFHKSNLWVVEMGGTIPVSHPPSMYTAEWGCLPRTRRDSFDNGMTVLCGNKHWSFTGYDKGAEIYPQLLPDGYLPYSIRLEYRRKKQISKLFGRSLTPWDLTDPDIYLKLIDLWEKNYLSIPILQGEGDFTKARSASQLKTMLAAIGLATVKSDSIFSIINATAKSRILSKKSACRMRAMVRDLMSSDAPMLESPLASELRSKVIAIAEREKEEVADYVAGRSTRPEI